MEEAKGTFKRVGYAVLRGQSWTYLLKNCNLIIGRKPPEGSSQWLVDLDLGDSRYIARQHALLVYNFKSQGFELRCLSKKARVKIDGKPYKYQDGAVPLKHRSVVTIYKTSFIFILPS